MADESTKEDFSQVKERLDEIVEAVSSDDMELEQALDLYEEAIKLGMQASSMLEENILGSSEEIDSEPAPESAEGEPQTENHQAEVTPGDTMAAGNGVDESMPTDEKSSDA